ncbi:MAG: hypothetical protein GX455_08190 [Phycisphaerae bacterium]|nr:hypothetical protein [Phycisphaerae bacterium]
MAWAAASAGMGSGSSSENFSSISSGWMVAPIISAIVASSRPRPLGGSGRMGTLLGGQWF